jgi:hypothetical protein
MPILPYFPMFFTKSSKIFLIETWIGWVIKKCRDLQF